MTAVETLRRAAALMRERAQAAPVGPWTSRPEDDDPDEHLVFSAPHFYEDTRGQYHGPRWVATTGDEFLGEQSAAIAEHIASWHPAVAVAVADWLESEANTAATVPRSVDHEQVFGHALAVARAYLGDQP